MAYQIFICYRWADTAGVAGRLYDVLEKEYGEGNVFFDVCFVNIRVSLIYSFQSQKMHCARISVSV
jgi:hypothetical protein